MEALEAAIANINLAEDDRVFSPRDYQIELFQAALDENIIAYLPTGSGKTYIAALLIKEKSHEVTKSLSAGGKRTVFLVPTIVLAIQQAAYLRKHTNLKVKEFYGSMGVDMWGENRWATEFESNHVLVMTAQIFVDILNHAFFSPYQLNLLVFDECHSAVKDAPMKQVLTKLHSCDVARRPKILGLTAALFRKRCKPREVLGVIKQLSEAMGCVVRIPTDIQTVYRCSTKPCEVIFQYDDVNIGQNPVSRELSKLIENLLASCTLASWIEDFLKLSQQYGGCGFNNTFAGKKSGKIEVLCDAIKDIGFLLEYFGPYGAFHCAQLYIPILVGAKSRCESSDFNKVVDLCHKIQYLFLKHSIWKQFNLFFVVFRDVCTSVFAKYSSKERLMLFVHANVIRLLDIIKKFNPKHGNPDEKVFKMCGIIFVERRSMASVLYHFLKDIRQHDQNFEFVKPLFTMGQASGSNSSLRESQILNMKQNDIMRDFRTGNCNLLVATSVLEEGIDIPECNLIVRFDKIRTYCDYVQTKGRARCKKAFFCMMVSRSDSRKFLEDLAQFHAIEQQLVATGNFEDDKDAILDNLFGQIIDPYTPYGNQGPRITLQSSISLVNRYCSQLVSYGASALVPRWSIKEVDESKADPSLLKKMKELMKQFPVVKSLSTKEPADKITLFQCRLLLPKSSPLQGEVVGDSMLTKRLAKRAAALRACECLHQLKELDNLHLLPVSHRKRSAC